MKFRRRIQILFFLVVLCVLTLRHTSFWTSQSYKDEEHNHSLVVKNANFLILDPAVTPREVDERHLHLLVIISTTASGILKRNAIRATWGKFEPPKQHSDLKGKTWRTVFMTALSGNPDVDAKLHEESRQYGDLLIFNYKDSYRKITKKLLGSFKWAATKKFDFVLKADDDVYVSIPRLLLWLERKGRFITHLYAGRLYKGNVERDKNHRHYVDPETLPFHYYPQFCKGAMVVLSSNLIPQMVKLSRQVPRIPPDDAYVGLLANELKVKPTRLRGLVQQSLLPYFYPFLDSCHYQSFIGLADSLRPDQLVYLHSQLSSLPDHSYWPCFARWSKIFMVILILAVFCLLIVTLKNPYF